MNQDLGLMTVINLVIFAVTIFTFNKKVKPLIKGFIIILNIIMFLLGFIVMRYYDFGVIQSFMNSFNEGL